MCKYLWSFPAGQIPTTTTSGLCPKPHGSREFLEFLTRSASHHMRHRPQSSIHTFVVRRESLPEVKLQWTCNVFAMIWQSKGVWFCPSLVYSWSICCTPFIDMLHTDFVRMRPTDRVPQIFCTIECSRLETNLFGKRQNNLPDTWTPTALLFAPQLQVPSKYLVWGCQRIIFERTEQHC